MAFPMAPTTQRYHKGLNDLNPIEYELKPPK